MVEVSAKRCREPNKKGKKKTFESENGVGDRNLTPRSRSWTLTAPAALPNEQAVADLPCIQHILDANRLTWSDVGLHPDCPFASFIHASQQQEPTWDLIIDTRRKCRSWLRRNPPHDFFPEACTKRCNEYSSFLQVCWRSAQPWLTSISPTMISDQPGQRALRECWGSAPRWLTSISVGIRSAMLGQRVLQECLRSAQRWLTSISVTMG